MKFDPDYEYKYLELNRTMSLCGESLSLFAVSSGQYMHFEKPLISVGKEDECDIKVDSIYVSGQHARFYFENSSWYLADTDSTNGVWINGIKIEPKVKYELYDNDVIDIAQEEKFIFNKTVKNMNEMSNEQIIKNLESAIEKYNITEDIRQKNKMLSLIISLIIECPMYVPISTDSNTMGDLTHKTQKYNDVMLNIATFRVDGEEITTIFTNKNEAEKGPKINVVRLHPCDFLPKLAALDKNIVINAFGFSSLIITTDTLKKVIVPNFNHFEEINSSKKTMSSTFKIKEGAIIDGKYELLKVVGKGNSSTTYLAVDRRLNMPRAAKICIKSGTSDEKIRLMINEVNVLKGFHHPAIPRIIDVIETKDYFCIIEEYIEGATLDNIVKRYGAQPENKVIDWTIQLCDILGYLHSQNPKYIHRDVKPANIILRTDGRIALIDFEIMRTYKHNHVCDTQNLGTKGYAAPEQYVIRQTDERTDVFGLGMTMHYLLTGIDPQMNNQPTLPICQINPRLSKGLEYIVSKCTELDPDKRYHDMYELKYALTNSSNCVYASPDIFKKENIKGIKNLFRKNRTNKNPNRMRANASKKPKFVKCSAGHFYNASKHLNCPFCSNAENQVDDGMSTMQEYRVWYKCPNCNINFEKSHIGKSMNAPIEVYCPNCGIEINSFRSYPDNKTEFFSDVPCVYASPDVMCKDEK